MSAVKVDKQIERAEMRSEILERMAGRPLDLNGKPQAVKAGDWRTFLASLGINVPHGKNRQWRMAVYSLRFKYKKIALSVEIDEGGLVGSYRLVNN